MSKKGTNSYLQRKMRSKNSSAREKSSKKSLKKLLQQKRSNIKAEFISSHRITQA